MNVKETLIFIKRPIGELADALRSSSKSVDGNEVTYYFEGQGPQGVDFGLSADLDAPDGKAWSHLLMEDPNPGVLAALLKLLRIELEEVHAATDWNGNPLVDLTALRAMISPSAQHRDSLTGLHNRAYLSDRLQALFGPGARHQTPFSLMIIDIDHFKKINDKFGHLAGDLVLREIATRLLATVGMEGWVVRSSGAAFVVVMPAAENTTAVAMAERIRVKIAGSFSELDGDRITVSVGVATQSNGLTRGNGEHLLKQAELALYEAKTRGNRVATRAA